MAADSQCPMFRYLLGLRIHSYVAQILSAEAILISITFVVDMIGDIALIAVPLIMLWRVALPRNQRLLVFAVFTASIFTCLASIALHVFLLGPKTWGPGAGKLVLFMSHVEVGLLLDRIRRLLIRRFYT